MMIECVTVVLGYLGQPWVRPNWGKKFTSTSLLRNYFLFLSFLSFGPSFLESATNFYVKINALDHNRRTGEFTETAYFDLWNFKDYVRKKDINCDSESCIRLEFKALTKKLQIDEIPGRYMSDGMMSDLDSAASVGLRIKNFIFSSYIFSFLLVNYHHARPRPGNYEWLSSLL